MAVNGDRMIEEVAHALEPGADVFSADGERMGHVLAVDDRFVKIDAPFRRDYWLNAAYVLRRDDGRVETSFAKRDLGIYKLPAPGIGDEDPLQAPVRDAIVNEDEAFEQRVQMERELAAQRLDLPHTQIEGDGPPDTFGTRGEPVEAELERLGVPLPYEGAPAAASPWRYVFGAFALLAVGTAVFVGVRRVRRQRTGRRLPEIAVDRVRQLLKR